MTDFETRLDGNAAAGVLSEIFPVEMTTSISSCGFCQTKDRIGALHLYMRAPGLVFRCTNCNGVLIRIVKSGDGRYHLDLRGVEHLEISMEGSS